MALYYQNFYIQVVFVPFAYKLNVCASRAVKDSALVLEEGVEHELGSRVRLCPSLKARTPLHPVQGQVGVRAPLPPMHSLDGTSPSSCCP